MLYCALLWLLPVELIDNFQSYISRYGTNPRANTENIAQQNRVHALWNDRPSVDSGRRTDLYGGIKLGFNAMRRTKNGRYFADDISKGIEW